MISLLLDQGLPRSVGAALPSEQWSVWHVADLGLSRASDRMILQFARKEKRHVITLDADFHALLATSGERGPSVVRLRIEGLKSKELALLLERIWPSIATAMANGALVTVTPDRIRIKHLPIG
ncbi:DUF5615 family PIN-like protein [Sulfuricystis multivorans]|uniref:DUF5615 family PIN-like protein n=1 Tax=Sulfuricystis multivorans TaxID=2211108 RepID=UPI000F825B2F|nr:DUF5615 family PIN-like protein [Sulfuricystis multivorans]